MKNNDTLILALGAKSSLYWKDIWQFRELLYVLAWRDVAVRYKQTIVGLLWVLLQPLLTMLILTLIFSRFAKLPSEGVAPYELLVLAGLLPWQLFSGAFVGASGSLVGNSNLISKVYFPRLIIPISSVIVSLIDFLVGFAILVFLMVWFGYMPGWQIFTLPFFVALGFFASLGPGLLICTLNIRYRDFRYIIPFIVQFGLYVSPVGFSSSIVPLEWKIIYSINPMVGIIDGFRWAILGGIQPLDMSSLSISIGVTILFLWIGIYQFRKTENTFADLI